MVEYVLAKDETRVRFPVAAHVTNIQTKTNVYYEMVIDVFLGVGQILSYVVSLLLESNNF